MEPFSYDLATFYDTDVTFTNPFCHFLYFHMGLNGRKAVTTENKGVVATVPTADKGTQTETPPGNGIFWSYFN